MDAAKRTLAKAVSWRAIAMIGTVILALTFFGGFKLALGYAVIETVVKFILYIFHERVWQRISFGKGQG